MKLLHVDLSILGRDSVSRRLSTKAVAEWQARHPDVTIVYRDLVAEPINHLTGNLLAAAQTEPSQLSWDTQ
jgi:FMN-dependent NADH-azoreductase